MSVRDWSVDEYSVIHLCPDALWREVEFCLERQTLVCSWCKSQPPESLLFLAKAGRAYEAAVHRAERAARLKAMYTPPGGFTKLKNLYLGELSGVYNQRNSKG